MNSERLKGIHQKLRDTGFLLDYTSQPEGDSLLFQIEKADCLVELWADGRLCCQFGIDMEELRLLLAGSSTEDIAEDELQRVARDHLRPMVNKYRGALLSDGFEETVDTSEQHYAICFVKTLDLSSPETVVSTFQDCLQVLG